MSEKAHTESSGETGLAMTGAQGTRAPRTRLASVPTEVEPPKKPFWKLKELLLCHAEIKGKRETKSEDYTGNDQ